MYGVDVVGQASYLELILSGKDLVLQQLLVFILCGTASHSEQFSKTAGTHAKRNVAMSWKRNILKGQARLAGEHVFRVVVWSTV